MALKFGDTKGSAQKKVDAYAYKDGAQTVRIIGDILPRYVYWLKGTNNKDIPVECLAFSRDKEKFDNIDKDWVPKYFPDIKCSWNYAVNCIDPTDGKVKVLNLKKKLFEQIRATAEDLGDPTDPDTGWNIVFTRAKTGPLAYNVEYTLNVLRCKVAPLSDAEKELVAAADSIDVKYPRPTSEEVKATLEKIVNGDDENQNEAADLAAAEREAVNELDS